MSNMILMGRPCHCFLSALRRLRGLLTRRRSLLTLRSVGPTHSFPQPNENGSLRGHDSPGIQVWLSTIRTKRVHGRYMGSYAKINTGRYRNFYVFIFTYSVGFLAIQLAAIRWGSRVLHRPRFSPCFQQADFWSPVSVPLWPPDGRPVAWPTEQFLTDDTIHQIAERWSRVAERLPPSPTGASMIKFCDLAKVTPLYVMWGIITKQVIEN